MSARNGATVFDLGNGALQGVGEDSIAERTTESYGRIERISDYRYRRFDGSTHTGLEFAGGAADGAYAATGLVVFRLPALGSGFRSYCRSNQFFTWGQIEVSTNKFIVSAWPNGVLTTCTTTAAAVANKTYVQIGVWHGSSLGFSVYLNGEEQALDSNETRDPGQPTATYSGSGNIVFGADEAGGEKTNCGIALAAYWRRALSPGEVQSLSSNPWQLLQPRRVVVPMRRQRPTESTEPEALYSLDQVNFRFYNDDGGFA